MRACVCVRACVRMCVSEFVYSSVRISHIGTYPPTATRIEVKFLKGMHACGNLMQNQSKRIHVRLWNKINMSKMSLYEVHSAYHPPLYSAI